MPRDDNYPKIGVFDAERPLTLRPHANGGWTISQSAPEQNMMGAELGAYSSAADMLAALTFALKG